MDHDLFLLFELAIPLVTLTGILTAAHAIMHVRTSQGAIAWAVSLVALPWIALPLYWIFGRRKFQGYAEARRQGNRRLHHLFHQLESELKPFLQPAATGQNGADRVFERLAPLPFTRHNNARLLVDGQATFDAIFAAVDGAREYVLMQFFIVHDDRIGRELKEHLIRKAREGIRIYFLFDEMGSHDLPERYVRELRAAGVDMRPFHTTRGRGNRFQLNFRNHRKVTVADGRVALGGGLNAGDEYMGRSPRFGTWRDTHIQVVGPAVQCIQLGFVEDWYWSTHQIPDLCWTPVAAPSGNHCALVLPTSPADDFESCSLFFTQAIHSAQRRVWITSPYFVPDQAVADALRLAGLRGVDVRILLPLKPDHLLVYLSAFAFFAGMLRAGVKMYRYKRGFLHQKVMLIDDDLASVGTANLDNRSFLLNFELTVLLRDREFAAQVETMLEADLRECRPISEDDYARRSFWFKAAASAARLMSPVQ